MSYTQHFWRVFELWLLCTNDVELPYETSGTTFGVNIRVKGFIYLLVLLSVKEKCMPFVHWKKVFAVNKV